MLIQSEIEGATRLGVASLIGLVVGLERRAVGCADGRRQTATGISIATCTSAPWAIVLWAGQTRATASSMGR